MFEGLSKTAQSELEMQKGRRVTHFQKSLHELAELEVCFWHLTCLHSNWSWFNYLFFQVKHAKAHAQMLRQTISAIKTEVWDPSLELKGSWDLSFGLYWLCIYKADQDFAGWRIFQVIRCSAIWLLTVCEELLWCTTMYQWAFSSPIWW